MSAKISVDAQLREEAAIQKRILDILTGKRRRTTPTGRRGISYYMQLCKQSTARLREAGLQAPHGDGATQPSLVPAYAPPTSVGDSCASEGSPVVSSMEDF